MLGESLRSLHHSTTTSILSTQLAHFAPSPLWVCFYLKPYYEYLTRLILPNFERSPLPSTFPPPSTSPPLSTKPILNWSTRFANGSIYKTKIFDYCLSTIDPQVKAYIISGSSLAVKELFNPQIRGTVNRQVEAYRSINL